MKNEKRKLIQTYLEKYLLLKNPDLKIEKNKLFTCPFQSEHSDLSNDETCKIYSTAGYKLRCLHPSHAQNNGYIGDIFNICRKYEDMDNLDDDDIGEYLIHLLGIQTDDEAQKALAVYANSGFNLIPLQPKSKEPIENISWKKTMSNELVQWQEWVNANLNLGLVLGKISNVVALDIDHPETLEKIKHLLGTTAIQTTSRGFHYLYFYEQDFENINHVNLRSKGYEMELRANNSYIVVAPSSVNGEKRFWNGTKVQQMPKELKEFLFSLIETKDAVNENPEELIKEAIQKENLGIKNGLEGLDGECNDVFIKLGGVLRKKMSPEQTEWALINFNKLLKVPMEYSSIKKMTYQLAKYYSYDKEELAGVIYERLIKLETCTAQSMSRSLKLELKDVEDILLHLSEQGKAKKIGHIYKPINKTEWETNFMCIGKPLNFKIPYFDDYARFDEGSLIVIGGASGTGKTALSCNFLKHFIDQKITPQLYCTEAGSKFRIVAPSLGIKVGDFKFKLVSDVSTVELDDDVVTIVDWLKAPNGEYAKTDVMFERLNEQLVKHRGLLIVFTQLKKIENSNNFRFYAEEMTEFYASLVAKYLHTPIKLADGSYGYDNINTMFQTQKIRDSKIGKQYITIPTFYNENTREVILRG